MAASAFQEQEKISQAYRRLAITLGSVQAFLSSLETTKAIAGTSFDAFLNTAINRITKETSYTMQSRDGEAVTFKVPGKLAELVEFAQTAAEALSQAAMDIIEPPIVLAPNMETDEAQAQSEADAPEDSGVLGGVI